MFASSGNAGRRWSRSRFMELQKTCSPVRRALDHSSVSRSWSPRMLWHIHRRIIGQGPDSPELKMSTSLMHGRCQCMHMMQHIEGQKVMPLLSALSPNAHCPISAVSLRAKLWAFGQNRSTVSPCTPSPPPPPSQHPCAHPSPRAHHPSRSFATSVNRGVLNLSKFWLNLSKLWEVLNLSKFCLNFFWHV